MVPRSVRATPASHDPAMTTNATSRSPASKPATLTAKASAIRRQIDAADKTDTGGNWRRRVAKARLLYRLRDQEATIRRRRSQPLDLDFDLPF